MDEESEKNQELINHVAKILSSDYPVFQDHKELILGVFMIFLKHPLAKRAIQLNASPELQAEIDGSLLDKIAAVINKTYLMKGENATINDDTALELITDYMLEKDEFIFYKNSKRILRKPE